MDSFTKICDAKTPTIIEKREEIARDILTEDKWITKNIQAVVMDAVVYQKDNSQKLMEQQINLKLTQNRIKRIAKEAWNRQVPVSVDGLC